MIKKLFFFKQIWTEKGWKLNIISWEILSYNILWLRISLKGGLPGWRRSRCESELTKSQSTRSTSEEWFVSHVRISLDHYRFSSLTILHCIARYVTVSGPSFARNTLISHTGSFSPRRVVLIPFLMPLPFPICSLRSAIKID